MLIDALKKIDLNVHQIQILTQLCANESAYNIYSLKKNCHKSSNTHKKRCCLKHFVTSTSREEALRFHLFKMFYSQTNYADVEIEMALKSKGRYRTLFDSNMRSIATTLTLVYQVLYMYILENFWTAVRKCSQGSKSDSYSYTYDKAVALL